MLSGARVLITLGPTEAPIDAVRRIVNTSSGATGCAIAEAVLAAGAEVVVLRGPGSRSPQPHRRLRGVPVRTVPDLLEVAGHELAAARFHAVVHAMAVLDYVPDAAASAKVESGQDEWLLRLVPTPKVIDRIRTWAPDALLIGFKLVVNETPQGMVEAALKLLMRSGADVVIANDLSLMDGDRHEALFVERDGAVSAQAHDERAIADEVVRRIAAWRADRA